MILKITIKVIDKKQWNRKRWLFFYANALHLIEMKSEKFEIAGLIS